MVNTKKILIVEDDTYIRDLYTELLTSEGFIVATAIDGQEGLTKVGDTHYDLILLDMMMPKVDGIAFLEVLNKNGDIKKQGQIVVLTNLAQDTVITKAKELGAVDFLIKSDLNPAEFLAKVKKLLV